VVLLLVPVVLASGDIPVGLRLLVPLGSSSVRGQGLLASPSVRIPHIRSFCKVPCPSCPLACQKFYGCLSVLSR